MISQNVNIIRTNKIGKPYVQSTDPSLTNSLVQNDLWLNPSAGTMKMWDGTGWVEMQFGGTSIKDNVISNRMMANDISASKVTAGVLQSQDGSFYLNLETGEAELLKLVMGGQVEGNIIATSSNGLTRVRLRGREGEKAITAGVIFEERESEDEDWTNAGQIYFGFSNRQTYANINAYSVGPYNTRRPLSMFYSGAENGYVMRAFNASPWDKAVLNTFRGPIMQEYDSENAVWNNVSPLIRVNGSLLDGTAVQGTGTATLTYQMNGLVKIDFYVRVTTAGSGSGDYGLSAAILRQLDSSIPALTPIDGGVLQVFTSAGALNTSYYGATLNANGSLWQPKQINSSGSVANINESAMTANIKLVGTCYATFTLE